MTLCDVCRRVHDGVHECCGHPPIEVLCHRGLIGQLNRSTRVPTHNVIEAIGYME